MNPTLKNLSAFVASLAAIALVLSQLSFIVVTNRSGTSLSSVAVGSEAFHLWCGELAPEQSRWFLRWADDSCGLGIEGRRDGKSFYSGTGFIISDSHGYLIDIAILPDSSFRLTTRPEPLLNLPPIVSTR